MSSLFSNPYYVSGFLNFDIGVGILIIGALTGSPIALTIAGGFLVVSAVVTFVGLCKSR